MIPSSLRVLSVAIALLTLPAAPGGAAAEDGAALQAAPSAPPAAASAEPPGRLYVHPRLTGTHSLSRSGPTVLELELDLMVRAAGRKAWGGGLFVDGWVAPGDPSHVGAKVRTALPLATGVDLDLAAGVRLSGENQYFLESMVRRKSVALGARVDLNRTYPESPVHAALAFTDGPGSILSAFLVTVLVVVVVSAVAQDDARARLG